MADSSESHVSSLSLPKLFRYQMLGIWFVLLLALVAMFMVGRQQAQDEAARVRHYDLGAAMMPLGSRIAQYRNTLSQWSQIPDFIASIESDNRQRQTYYTQEFQRLLIDSIQVRLLPVRLDTVDFTDYRNPPVSFAAQAMMRQALRADDMQDAEAHLFGTAQQHFNLVQRIDDNDGQPLALLLASFSLKALQSDLQGAEESGVYLEIQQPAADGIPLVLAHTGERSSQNLTQHQTRVIPGTRWTLNVWQQPHTDGTNIWAPIQALLVLIASLGLIGWLTSAIRARLREAIRNDQTSLLLLAEDMAQGRMRQMYPVRLQEFTGVLDSMTKLAQAVCKPALGRKPGPDPSSANLRAETIGRVTGKAGITEDIFRSYDIRGVVDEDLTVEVVESIGRAIGTKAQALDQETIVVARDARLSGPKLLEALMKGLMSTGREVVDIGVVPTPVLYFATEYLGTKAGVMITGSHNPVEYNGLKIVLDGRPWHGDDIQSLRRLIDTGRFHEAEGTRRFQTVESDYMGRLTSDIGISRRLRVVVDCGNGVAGRLAPQMIRRMGCDVVELFCHVDGTFPNHHPNPSQPENLRALMEKVVEEQADVGVAFDGDGDRLVMVDSAGEIVWGDQLLMLFSRNILEHRPHSTIVYDVKCSSRLPALIEEWQGRAVVSRSGHTVIKERMLDEGATLAGEFTGHIIFADRWFPFDDALYATGRLLEILAADARSSHVIMQDFPKPLATPELQIPMREGEHHRFMDRLRESAQCPGAELTLLDGLRADFDDAWGLVRASNTTPSLTLRFEADDDEAMQRIQKAFKTLLLELDPELMIPF